VDMKATGAIISIRGQVAEVEFTDGERPTIHDILIVADQPDIKLEVVSSSSATTFYCLILTHVPKIPRGTPVINTREPLMIPVGEDVLGRAFDIFAKDHDKEGEVESHEKRPLFNTVQYNLKSTEKSRSVIETGIKAVDFFSPIIKGGKTALVGGAGTGKTVTLTELVNRLVIRQKNKEKNVAVFSAVGERSREAQELHEDLKTAEVLESTSILLGQMGENPSIRFRTAFAGATVAEYFRDAMQKDVYFFMDNVYRFAQAGHELAMLMHSIPSEDGYQPTLGSEMASLQERLISTDNGAITSFMALFVPSDDMTDYGVRSVFPYLDAMIILSREVLQSGRFPAVDLLKSTSVALTPLLIGEKHYHAYIQAKQTLEKASSLERIVSLVGESELDPDNLRTYTRAKIITNFMTQDLFIGKSEKGESSVFLPMEETVQTIRDILDGKYDDVDPYQFRYIGSVKNLQKHTT
jgi:F-type H+/Na+-transporting ATPase subunit beta